MYLFDQVQNKQRYASRQWYYTTLVRWCGVEGSISQLGELNGGPYGGALYRDDIAYNLYPTCFRLFGNESPLIDDAITQLLAGWTSEKICRKYHLCVLHALGHRWIRRNLP